MSLLLGLAGSPWLAFSWLWAGGDEDGVFLLLFYSFLLDNNGGKGVSCNFEQGLLRVNLGICNVFFSGIAKILMSADALEQ